MFYELPASDSGAVGDVIRYTMVSSLELFERSLTKCMVLIYIEPFRNRQTHKGNLPWIQLSHLTLLTLMCNSSFHAAAIFDCVW